MIQCLLFQALPQKVKALHQPLQCQVKNQKALHQLLLWHQVQNHKALHQLLLWHQVQNHKALHQLLLWHQVQNHKAQHQLLQYPAQRHNQQQVQNQNVLQHLLQHSPIVFWFLFFSLVFCLFISIRNLF